MGTGPIRTTPPPLNDVFFSGVIDDVISSLSKYSLSKVLNDAMKPNMKNKNMRNNRIVPKKL